MGGRVTDQSAFPCGREQPPPRPCRRSLPAGPVVSHRQLGRAGVSRMRGRGRGYRADGPGQLDTRVPGRCGSARRNSLRGANVAHRNRYERIDHDHPDLDGPDRAERSLIRPRVCRLYGLDRVPLRGDDRPQQPLGRAADGRAGLNGRQRGAGGAKPSVLPFPFYRHCHARMARIVVPGAPVHPR
jgi:hypothetical protein